MHDRTQYMPSVYVTRTNLNIWQIVTRALAIKFDLDLRDGPLISNQRGIIWSSQHIHEMMQEVLCTLLSEQQNLFPTEIIDEESIKENYKSFWTFRRTPDTIALEQGVATNDIVVVNRWRVINEANMGKKISLPLKQLYDDFDKLSIYSNLS